MGIANTLITYKIYLLKPIMNIKMEEIEYGKEDCFYRKMPGWDGEL
ncbi:MAG: hypothetical protein WAX69_02190 [Victivallales bacterium]